MIADARNDCAKLLNAGNQLLDPRDLPRFPDRVFLSGIDSGNLDNVSSPQGRSEAIARHAQNVVVVTGANILRSQNHEGADIRSLDFTDGNLAPVRLVALDPLNAPFLFLYERESASGEVDNT